MKNEKNIKSIVVNFEALIDVSEVYPSVNAMEILNIIIEEASIHAPEINKYRIITEINSKEIDEESGQPIKIIHKGYLLPNDLRHYAVMKQFYAMNMVRLMRKYNFSMQLLRSDLIINDKLIANGIAGINKDYLF